MNILFYGGLGCGGAEHQMVIVAKQMSQRGFSVIFLTPDKGAFYGGELIKAGIKVVEIPKSKIISKLKLTIPFGILFLFNLVRKERIDVGISFLSEHNFANCVVAMLMRGKYKAITGLRNARKSLLLSTRELIYTKFETYASLKVCNSENANKMYIKCFPQYENHLVTIYNIVIPPKITSEYMMKKDGKLHIIVPASYREVKNPFGLLQALLLMSDTERSLFDITWYGETRAKTLPYYIKLKEEIENHKLEDVFILKDAIPDISDKMYEKDVVALFSSSEGLPNAICEGMMMGKPVVMSKVSDYDSLVDENNGFLCEWNNPDSIKSAILKISVVGDLQLLKMGDASAKKARELFSETSNIRKWMSAIEIVNRKG